jgi:sterol desaturase/sphingolipid hydroxylase (fatty acid hydroxylase superfamily)
VNFGLSLSIWDYAFGTAHIPSSGRDIELGFDGSEAYPSTFWQQMIAPFLRRK